MSEYLVDPNKLSHGFVTLDNTRKKGPEFFLHWRNCLYFLKIVFSSKSYVLKYWSYNDLSNSRSFSMDPFEVSTEACYTRFYERKQAKLFLHCEDCLFQSKDCVFNNLASPWGNDLIPYLVKVRLASGLIQTVPWGSSNSNIR